MNFNLAPPSGQIFYFFLFNIYSWQNTCNTNGTPISLCWTLCSVPQQLPAFKLACTGLRLPTLYNISWLISWLYFVQVLYSYQHSLLLLLAITKKVLRFNTQPHLWHKQPDCLRCVGCRLGVDDRSLENSLARAGCEVHCFDPSLKQPHLQQDDMWLHRLSVDWRDPNPAIIAQRQYASTKKLATILNDFGHRQVRGRAQVGSVNNMASGCRLNALKGFWSYKITWNPIKVIFLPVSDGYAVCMQTQAPSCA